MLGGRKKRHGLLPVYNLEDITQLHRDSYQPILGKDNERRDGF